MSISGNTLYIVLFVSISYANAGLFKNIFNRFSQDSDRESDTGIGVPSGGGGSESVTEFQHFNGTKELLNSIASPRGGHYQSHYPHHSPYHHQHNDQNMDLYGLLAGLSFASLLGATIIFLARRNTTAGRRRRSLDDDSMNEISDAIDDPWWEKEKNKVELTKLY